LEFGAKTNWIVITGAPSSGKTSVIMELAQRGYATQSEVAREVIEKHLKEGKTLAEIRAQEGALQREMLGIKIARERALDTRKTVFMDRAVDDSITYYRLAGLDPAEAIEASRLFQYRAIFIFDRLPLVKDDVRSEDDARADQIDRMLEEDYRMMGYAPVRVPVVPVPERADFIISRIPSSA
jgi:predicted ATPase